MPTENGEIGTIYIADNDGNYHELGGIKKINVELDESVDVVEMDFSFNDEITIPLTLSRKSKKIWGKILMMPKYVITEWCFPRKKKRGTMRRNRRNCGANMRSEKEYLDKTFPEHDGGEWLDITDMMTGGSEK